MQIHSDPRFQSLISQMEQLHRESKTEEMRTVLEELQVLAEAEQDDIGLAAAYFYQDALFATDPSSEFYMQYVERALKIAQAKNIPYYEMKASNSLGIMNSELSDFHTSLEFYLRAVHIAEEHPEYCYAAIALNNVGNLFVWLEDYPVATGYLERAYHKGIAENQDDRQLIALILLNLIELHSYMGKYQTVTEWKERGQGILNEEEQGVVACIELVNEARQLFRRKNYRRTTEKILAFLKLSSEISDYIYSFRCYINSMRMGIKMNNFELCASLMKQIEWMQSQTEITSFSFEYAAIRVAFYEAFPTRLAEYAIPYFQEYYRQSQSRIQQLRDTYARSLSVKIALEEARDENKSVHMQNEQLQRDIERDIFTNLYNKVSTKKHVSAAMSVRAPDELQGLLLIDIDLFKLINDNYGHVFGDQVIAEVAMALEGSEEPNKIVGRFGGDEFMVFLGKQKSIDALKEATSKLMERMHNCLQFPDAKISPITTSIGVCVIDSDIKFEDAFLIADQALYRAKELGRNRFEIGQPLPTAECPAG